MCARKAADPTPAQIRAGEKALQDWLTRGGWWDDGARDVYLAMASVHEGADVLKERAQFGGDGP